MTQADRPRKKRFYWLEGISRSQVEKSLADRRPSRLREQAPRRVMVALMSLLIAALALAVFIPPLKLRTYGEFALLITGLLLYFRLRRAVRYVAVAPEDLLDERQLAVRNAAYAVAYQALCMLTLAYAGLLRACAPGGVLQHWVSDRYWTPIGWSYVLSIMSLPVMVLAWRLPSEPVDDAA